MRKPRDRSGRRQGRSVLTVEHKLEASGMSVVGQHRAAGQLLGPDPVPGRSPRLSVGHVSSGTPPEQDVTLVLLLRERERENRYREVPPSSTVLDEQSVLAG